MKNKQNKVEYLENKIYNIKQKEIFRSWLDCLDFNPEKLKKSLALAIKSFALGMLFWVSTVSGMISEELNIVFGIIGTPFMVLFAGIMIKDLIIPAIAGLHDLLFYYPAQDIKNIAVDLNIKKLEKAKEKADINTLKNTETKELSEEEKKILSPEHKIQKSRDIKLNKKEKQDVDVLSQ